MKRRFNIEQINWHSVKVLAQHDQKVGPFRLEAGRVTEAPQRPLRTKETGGTERVAGLPSSSTNLRPGVRIEVSNVASSPVGLSRPRAVGGVELQSAESNAPEPSIESPPRLEITWGEWAAELMLLVLTVALVALVFGYIWPLSGCGALMACIAEAGIDWSIIPGWVGPSTFGGEPVIQGDL